MVALLDVTMLEDRSVFDSFFADYVDYNVYTVVVSWFFYLMTPSIIVVCLLNASVRIKTSVIVLLSFIIFPGAVFVWLLKGLVAYKLTLF